MSESPIYPDVREWVFTNRRTGESRRYEQAELTIDGEMHFFRLATEAMSELKAADFPFERLGALFPDENDFSKMDLGLVSEMLSIVASKAALLMTRAALLMLGWYEFDENGRRDPQYAVELTFLRSCIHTADVIEMFETFVQQNDVERLRAPFLRAWNAVTVNMPVEATPTAPVTSLPPSTFSSPPATAPLTTSDAASRGGSSTEP